MKDNFYITQRGVIYRKDNTIYFQNENLKRILPINVINAIYCMERITIRSGAAYFLMNNSIPVHFFNSRGYYKGSLYPKDFLISGKVKIKQVEHYLDESKRLYIAKEIVKGIKSNIKSILNNYVSAKEMFNSIDNYCPQNANKLTELLSIEGAIWKKYYSSFDVVLKWNKEFDKRTKRPPSNELNALISFGNSVLYSITLTELYNTYLDPSISFLHEPHERRYSLALDISEIFKPIIVGSSILYFVNKKIAKNKDFIQKFDGVFLSDFGKKKFLGILENRLKTTIFHTKLKRKVSYQRLIRLEGYKLIKHLLGDSTYRSFKLRW